MRLNSPSRLLCALALVHALPGAYGVADAAPVVGSYTCVVPRALLCEGCASQLAIRLLPGGGCRVSFTTPSPGAEASPAGGAPEQAPFTFVIEPGPAAAAPAARRAATAGHWRSRLAARRQPLAEAKAAHARCFVFNSNEYCE
jgi:hypothetical protein